MRPATFALAALCLASACGASARSQGGERPGSVAQSPPPPSTCTSTARSRCVTAAARGGTVSVGLGGRLTLMLAAPRRTFTIPSGQGGRALQQLGQVRRSDGAASVAYRAVRVGSVQLRALERPRCRAGAVCPQFVVLWTLRVRVSRRAPTAR